jgi:hypothetical protein
MMLLQNYMDLPKVVPDSCTEPCPASPNDGNEGIEIKVEPVTDIQDEEDLVPTEFPSIKVEHEEVSCTCVCTLFDSYTL